MKKIFMAITLCFLLVLSITIHPAESAQMQQDKWVKKADMLTARGGAVIATANGKIYAIGGGQPQMSGGSRSVEEYNPDRDKWEIRSDMNEARGWHSASSINGKIYIFGGLMGVWLSSVEEYDPIKDIWTEKKNMPRIWAAHGSCTLGSKIYVMGGCCGDTDILYEYDPSKDSWTGKANMPTARQGLKACAVNGKIYAIGGVLWPNGITNSFSTVEEYDPIKDTWTKKADMPTPRGYFAASVVGSKIYAIGGIQNTPPNDGMTTVEIYDTQTDTWTKGLDISIPRWYFNAVTVNGKIYAIGGVSGQNLLSTVEEYDTGFSSQSVNSQDKLSSTWGSIKAIK